MTRLFNQYRNQLYLALITVLGFILRLINLKQQPFWGDEVLSLDITMQYRHIPQMLHYLADVEIHPPLYYLMQHYWIGWFGTGTAGVRSLSLIFGLGCIVGAYFLAKALFQNPKIGLLSSLIVAILPFQLEFSQEARPYIIFCFFGIIAAWALWQYYRTKNYAFGLVYILANVVGLYLHYSYLFFLFALAAWGLFEVTRGERKSREFVFWLVAHAAILLAFSWWLVPFLFKISLGHYTIFGWDRVFPSKRGYILDGVVNQLIWLTKMSMLPSAQLVISFIAKLCILTGVIWIFIKSSSNEKIHKYLPQIYLLWLSLVPLFLFFFSPQSLPYTQIFERHIILSSVTLGLLIAWTVSLLPKKTSVFLLAIFLVSLIPYDTDVLGNDATWNQYYNLQAAGEIINENYQPGDLVIVDIGVIRTDLSHYLRDDVPVVELLPINYFGIDSWNTRHTLGFIENEYQSRTKDPTESEVTTKLNQLDSIYHPKRVWLYGFSKDDSPPHIWFTNRGWRHIYSNLDDVLRLDLYSQQ